jgi:hypothetical protein
VAVVVASDVNRFFTQPVDPVALNLPTYRAVISHPMDLGTVQAKLAAHLYKSELEVIQDARYACARLAAWLADDDGQADF